MVNLHDVLDEDDDSQQKKKSVDVSLLERVNATYKKESKLKPKVAKKKESSKG